MGITLKQYWEQTELELESLDQRLKAEGQADCKIYKKYHQTSLEMIAMGKALEDHSIFKLKSAGAALEKKPLEFGADGIDRLPSISSYATFEFTKSYHSHLMRFFYSDFQSSNILINAHLPSQKPEIKKLADLLQIRIAAYEASLQVIAVVEEKSQVQLSVIEIQEAIAINLPYAGCKHVLESMHWLEAIKANVCHFLFSNVKRWQVDILAIPKDIHDKQIFSRQKELEQHLIQMHEKSNEWTILEVEQYQNFKALKTIIDNILEYERLIAVPFEGYQWEIFIERYSEKLPQIYQNVYAQSEGYYQRLEAGLLQSVMILSQEAHAKPTEFGQIFKTIKENLIKPEKHVQDIKVIAQIWLQHNPIKIKMQADKPEPKDDDLDLTDFTVVNVLSNRLANRIDAISLDTPEFTELGTPAPAGYLWTAASYVLPEFIIGSAAARENQAKTETNRPK